MDIVKQIGYAMSLRAPQREALEALHNISSEVEYKIAKKANVEAIASLHSEGKRTIKVAEEFSFPSFCFEMATGIGKTRLMGASIYYLYRTKGYRHFFILAPGDTIYEKLKKESLPESAKYLFKGLEAELGTRPRVFNGDNYLQYNPKQSEFLNYNELQIFIFNIGKIFMRGDVEFNFHRYQETLGSSFSFLLAGFDDLVICMDEAHRYYAPASMKAIDHLKPVLGLEFTATPKSNSNVIYSYDLAKGAGKFLKIPVMNGRTNLAGYNADDVQEMKLMDGMRLHENRNRALYQYCADNNLDYVKPIVLVSCKDTTHAQKVRAIIDSDNFCDGRYMGKVIEIHSGSGSAEAEENIAKLLTVENSRNPFEIVLHVYKLKEGWDVNNLFTIIPLNAAKSEILAMQTIGRGLRLPFGYITGKPEIDTLDIVAHEHYREIVEDLKANPIFRTRDLDKNEIEPSRAVIITPGFDDRQLAFLDDYFTGHKIKRVQDVTDPLEQSKIYEAYIRSVVAKPVKKDDGAPQPTLFGLLDEPAVKSAKTTIQPVSTGQVVSVVLQYLCQ
ncbi:MAG: DEAD/DEAH box helicase family protein [Christensenellaceae bacterium]|jgi:type III restriction enzyme|nr:DEAD/DEAH box helicase family protein [Christensenellaceae bacterium]